MTTLYIRDVPDDVAAALKARAAEEGQSLSGYVGAQLARIARRPTNAEVVDRLRARDRSAGASTDDIVGALHSGWR